MTHYASSERRALADLLDQLGPDQPTLCDGWQTADLAAHLVVRERRPDAALGVVLRPLAGHTEKVQLRARDRRPWPDLVTAVRNGPPALWRPIDEMANTLEYFVHHEDVRRARPAWAPRVLETGEEDALWRRLKPFVRLAARKAPDKIVLSAPGRPEVAAGRGGSAVTIAGTPQELVLFVFGRSAVADVELRGDAAAVERLKAVSLGI